MLYLGIKVVKDGQLSECRDLLQVRLFPIETYVSIFVEETLYLGKVLKINDVTNKLVIDKFYIMQEKLKNIFLTP